MSDCRCHEGFFSLKSYDQKLEMKSRKEVHKVLKRKAILFLMPLKLKSLDNVSKSTFGESDLVDMSLIPEPTVEG